MKRTSLVAALIATSLMVSAFDKTPARGKTGHEAHSAKLGILLLAHGGKPSWNEEVNKLAAQVDKITPIEVAFGMATKRNIQSAVERLVARNVREIVAVPLFISPHSSIIACSEYLLGLRATAPPELARFAKMDHGNGDHKVVHAVETSFDPTTPIKVNVPIRMAPALGRHPIVADILLSRGSSISQEPKREVVIVVAHGPVSDEENGKWLADMGVLVEHMRRTSSFRRIEYLTVRDDAPEPIRSRATAELRAAVERATKDGNKVLIVPLLLSYGGIEEGVRKRLEGLSYRMSGRALLPDERLARWVLLSAGVVAQK